MKQINSFEELKQLAPKEKFYVLSEGSTRPYIFCSLHPMSEGLVVAIDDCSYKNAVCFSEMDFNYGRQVFLKGEYVSSEVGSIMISQLEEIIKSVDKIWLNS
jgi:uncharacterized protein (DUF1919 family)